MFREIAIRVLRSREPLVVLGNLNANVTDGLTRDRLL